MVVGRAEGCGAAAAKTPPRRAVEEAWVGVRAAAGAAGGWEAAAGVWAAGKRPWGSAVAGAGGSVAESAAAWATATAAATAAWV